MSIFMKKLAILTASLMMGTFCFAMDLEKDPEFCSANHSKGATIDLQGKCLNNECLEELSKVPNLTALNLERVTLNTADEPITGTSLKYLSALNKLILLNVGTMLDIKGNINQFPTSLIELYLNQYEVGGADIKNIRERLPNLRNLNLKFFKIVTKSPSKDSPTTQEIRPLHRPLVKITAQDIELFKNLILVSKEFFYILTGTGNKNKNPSLCAKKYIWVANGYESLLNYQHSRDFLWQLPKIKLRGMNWNNRKAKVSKYPSFHSIYFNPEAITFLDCAQQTCFFGDPRRKVEEKIAQAHHIANQLKGLTKLEKLNLENTRVSDEYLEIILQPLTALTYLNLSSNIQLSRTSVAYLSHLSNLTSLNLLYMRNKGGDLGLLPTSLIELNLEECIRQPQDITDILRLTNLRTLNICHFKNVSDDDICTLSQLTNLQNLRLDLGPLDAGHDMWKARMPHLNFTPKESW